MTENTATSAEESAETPAQESEKVDTTDWKAEARKWERQAKANKAAADELASSKQAAKTAEERMAELEKEIAATKHEALKRRVQAAHGISDEDADLFLTGSDEESLTAQAKRLADRESERKKKNNVSPREGNNPSPGGNEEMRDFARNLFSRANAD